MVVVYYIAQVLSVPKEKYILNYVQVFVYDAKSRTYDSNRHSLISWHNLFHTNVYSYLRGSLVVCIFCKFTCSRMYKYTFIVCLITRTFNFNRIVPLLSIFVYFSFIYYSER